MHKDGTYVTGWPKATGGDVRYVALGDLDGDNLLEIVAGSDDHKVYAWHNDGSTVSGFPKIMSTGTDVCPAIGDLNGDGQPEIVIGSDDYKVYAWTVPSSYGRLDWPMFQHDVQHTGLYVPIQPPQLWEPWIYDTNGNSIIEKNEAGNAAKDYFDGKITMEQALEVLLLHFASQP